MTIDTSNITKTSRIVIRKLVALVKYYSDHQYCEKNCDCDVCKALNYAKQEDAKLTHIIEVNKRARK